MGQQTATEIATRELVGFLRGYLGRREYGNLRTCYGAFPRCNDRSTLWRLIYNHLGADSSVINLLYHGEESWSENQSQGELPVLVLSKVEAIGRFFMDVSNIPCRRIALIERYANELVQGKFLFGRKLEDLYSSEEIKIIREIVSRKFKKRRFSRLEEQ